MSRFWRRRRVVVTGGNGFLGTFLVEELRRRGCSEPFVPRSTEYDLVTREACRRLYRDARPEVVIHLAARVGGIGVNREHPGRFFFDNLMMGANLIEEGRRAGLGKFVQIGTVCSYPKRTPVPFHEEELWNGFPEETNAPYGIAKRALLEQLRAYRLEYGFNGIYLIPVNLYGPGDNFDRETGHVIPALIRKCMEAREAAVSSVPIWGSGRPTREFLYVEDCARGIVEAAELYDDPNPVNLGTGREVRIADLARLIAELCGYEGKLVYEPHKPDGQPRRSLEVSRAREQFGFQAEVELEEGLRRTIAWLRTHRDQARLNDPIVTSERA